MTDIFSFLRLVTLITILLIWIESWMCLKRFSSYLPLTFREIILDYCKYINHESRTKVNFVPNIWIIQQEQINKGLRKSSPILLTGSFVAQGIFGWLRDCVRWITFFLTGHLMNRKKFNKSENGDELILISWIAIKVADLKNKRKSFSLLSRKTLYEGLTSHKTKQLNHQIFILFKFFNIFE